MIRTLLLLVAASLPMTASVVAQSQGVSSYGFIAHPSLAAKTLAQLVRLARANPGALTVGSAGLGTSTHLAIEYLSSVAGIKPTHVPFKGDGQAIPAR